MSPNQVSTEAATTMSEARLPGSSPNPASIAEACSLAPDRLVERLAMIRSEIEPHARSKRSVENGFAWDFDATAEMRVKLENLVRLERDCCRHLDFWIWETPDPARLRLEVIATDPSSALFEGLEGGGVATDGSVNAKRWKRLAKRGSLAAVASLAACCLLPLVLVSVAGVGIAAPLMKLDHPVSIAAGAVAFAVLFGWIEKRRARTIAAGSGDRDVSCGC